MNESQNNLIDICCFFFVDNFVLFCFPFLLYFIFVHVNIIYVDVFMNASCALQHFCDIHGPQILLCTDTRNYIQDVNDNDDGDLKAFFSQYIKSEHPQGKIECKVNRNNKTNEFSFIHYFI